jgi:hypothetical protein
MKYHLAYLPPNLAKLGVKRIGWPISPDLETIYCAGYADIVIIVGNIVDSAGIEKHVITSGYRDDWRRSGHTSEHHFALALDVAFESPQDVIRFGEAADGMCTRLGLYPARGFAHVGFAPHVWITHYRKWSYWVDMGDKGLVGCKAHAELIKKAKEMV